MKVLWAGVLFLTKMSRKRPQLAPGLMVDTESSTILLNQSMETLNYSRQIQSDILVKLDEVGFESLSELTTLARDFIERPEVFSNLLQVDFGFNALMAHRTRALAMNLLQLNSSTLKYCIEPTNIIELNSPPAEYLKENTIHITPIPLNHFPALGNTTGDLIQSDTMEQKIVYKQVVVNQNAKHRRNNAQRVGDQHDYGLPSNYNTLFPQLAMELVDFYSFMTRPSTASQEEHIRQATANVYLRHAKLFLGWYVKQQSTHTVHESLSLFTIIPSKDKECADSILEFVLWLRVSRSISISYEANLLRGLTKLIKFRFARESKSDPTYGDKPFDDIPIVREIRKLHRDANKRQITAPRSSDEDQKWLSWPLYLKVVESVKDNLLHQLNEYKDEIPIPIENIYSPTERKIATVYQYYLILAFFASVPDRQRTIRELQLGKSFIKDTKQNIWTIKHSPDDYKTGKTYGDRPPLSLAPRLVPAIDDFLKRWRPCLHPSTDSLFVQPRTGKPLTQDSVYQIVARNCYKYTGKRTNPHLLRDMIVTHVKESDASDKELESLALFMGHSVNMQRNSYDRRTLSKKVAPAVELIHNINKYECQ